MPSYAELQDIGAKLQGQYSGFVSVTAGGGNDGSANNGPWYDLQSAESAKVIIGFTTTLSDGETLDIAAHLEDADDSSGTNSATYSSTMSQTTVATGGSGGSTETGVAELDFNLRQANSHARVVFTPTMSNSATDTADILAVSVLSGQDEFPVSNQDN